MQHLPSLQFWFLHVHPETNYTIFHAADGPKHVRSCTPPPFSSPPPVLPREGGLGDRHLVNTKFIATAHCIVVWVTVL